MRSLRTLDTATAYRAYRKVHSSDQCWLCEKVVKKNFVLWNVVGNAFPYDEIAASHDILVLARHAAREEMTAEEKSELESIKAEFVDLNYDYIIESSIQNQSVPRHYHLHLIVGK